MIVCALVPVSRGLSATGPPSKSGITTRNGNRDQLISPCPFGRGLIYPRKRFLANAGSRESFANRSIRAPISNRLLVLPFALFSRFRRSFSWTGNFSRPNSISSRSGKPESNDVVNVEEMDKICEISTDKKYSGYIPPILMKIDGFTEEAEYSTCISLSQQSNILTLNRKSRKFRKNSFF